MEEDGHQDVFNLKIQQDRGRSTGASVNIRAGPKNPQMSPERQQLAE
jgi:hypothetical protein